LTLEAFSDANQGISRLLEHFMAQNMPKILQILAVFTEIWDNVLIW